MFFKIEIDYQIVVKNCCILSKIWMLTSKPPLQPPIIQPVYTDIKESKAFLIWCGIFHCKSYNRKGFKDLSCEPNIYLSWFTFEIRVNKGWVWYHKTSLRSPGNFFTDHSNAVLLLWIIFVIYRPLANSHEIKSFL